eukprot:1490554-Rhodomonas_salina.2
MLREDQRMRFLCLNETSRVTQCQNRKDGKGVREFVHAVKASKRKRNSLEYSHECCVAAFEHHPKQCLLRIETRRPQETDFANVVEEGNLTVVQHAAIMGDVAAFPQVFGLVAGEAHIHIVWMRKMHWVAVREDAPVPVGSCHE